MDFTQVTIYTTTAGIDVLTGILLDLHITGFEVQDAQDFEEFLTNTTIHWDYVEEDLMKLRSCETNVKVYLPQNPQGAETLALLREALQRVKKQDTAHRFGRLEMDSQTLKTEDWENNWKQYFKPFPVGKQFIIKPSWEEVQNPEGRTILEIDPASSFGTGSHSTTKLCIEALEKMVTPGCEMLDMGCGSGILSVAGLLLGAKHVNAVDIELNAAKTSAENVQKNGISPDHFASFCGDIITDTELYQTLSQRSYDVIAANIVADVIKGMADRLYALLKMGGQIVVSGIIAPRAGEVRDTLTGCGFVLLEENEKDDWASLRLTK